MSGRRAADLVIGGAGPAGLATAILAAEAGARVVVLDRAAGPPVDKACGEGLMPDGAAALEPLGVALGAGAAFPFRGLRWIDGDAVAEGRFAARPGLGVRRTVLHRALADRAESCGAELRWGETVTGIEADGLRTRRGTHRGRWLVAADGLCSPLRRAAGLEGAPPRRRRFGLRRHFAVAPWSDCVEVHWGRGIEAYVTPVDSGCVGVALLWNDAAPRRRPAFDDALLQWPALHERLHGAPTCSTERGAGPLHRRPRAVVRANLALVGDAAGYVDAITGEGLSVAFHQARALVEAIGRGDLRRWPAAHRRVVALPNAIAHLLLAVERRPRLRRRLIRALGAAPVLFERLLAIHVREGSRLPFQPAPRGACDRRVP